MFSVSSRYYNHFINMEDTSNYYPRLNTFVNVQTFSRDIVFITQRKRNLVECVIVIN